MEIQVHLVTGFPQNAVNLKQDNTACINIADSSSNHARTKHIDLLHHFVREAKKNGLIKSGVVFN